MRPNPPFNCAILFLWYSISRHPRLGRLVRLFFLITSLFGVSASASETRFDGTVIFLRHALAPGNGDPRNFDLNDCRTQRNLDEIGRRQARAIGKRIAAAKLNLAGIFSSQWCRCLETALLLDLGSVIPFDGLNSFFQNHAPRDATLAKLTSKLDNLPHDGAPIIMVTHYVTIQAVANIAVPSGGAVLYDLTTGYARELPLAAFSPPS